MQNSRPWFLSVIVALLGVCAPCTAETVARIDLRSGLPEPIDYYIVVCARESEPWGAGHAFVVWAQHDKRTGRVDSQGFGFYPEVERVALRLFTGDGAIRDESTRSASTNPSLLTHRLVIQVDREVFEAALNVKEQWVESGINYRLLRRNCMHFAYDVMKVIQPGVPRPDFGERPSSYVSRLMALRQDRHQTTLERLPATVANGRR